MEMGDGMRWSVVFFLVAALMVSCAPRDKGPQRIRENGVEVVVNGAAPYAVAGQPRALSLREEFRIDLEDAALAEAGLTDASTIDVDSRGRIYLFRRGGNKGRVIFRFDERGRFEKSFGTIGQGPGELMYPSFLRITAKDEIPAYSQGAGNLVFLDADGGLLRSSRLPKAYDFLQQRFVLLPNGNILAQYFSVDRQNRISKFTLAIFNAQWSKIRDLHDFEMPGRPEELKNPFAILPLIAVTDHAFFVNSAASSSDIAAYDLEGKLVRLIRSPFPALRIPPDYKKELLDRIPKGERYEPIRAIIRNVEMWPLFQAFFADDRDHLFVEGFEKDPTSGANMCDVFSPDGVRILRTGLGSHEILRLVFETQPFDIVIKKDCCYCLREKADGFKEVVVYSMRWT
jgi:hypothetical protein